MKNGYQIAIDLTNQIECNLNIINSPIFSKEDMAIKWYRKLDFSTNEVKDLDFIMVHWNNDEIADTYII